MSTVGQVDPKIQAMFDENLATTRSANAAVTAKLKADQDRLAAEAKAREEKHQKDLAASLASAKEVGRHTEQRKPQWQQRDRSAGEMAFGPEDDEGGYSPAPVSAPAPPPPPPLPPVAPAPMRARRPARVDDDDDDLSGQTWLS